MLQNYNIWKTASVFFYEPTAKHYLKEISLKTKVAHTSVKKHLSGLVKQKIILEKFEKKGKRIYPIYSSNLEGEKYRHYKTIFNLDNIFHSNLIKHLEESIMPKSIVLFGSFPIGEDIEDSDIDLFIEAEEVSLDLSKYKKKLKRRIQLHFNKDFNSYPIELKNNILNGKTLSGNLELK